MREVHQASSSRPYTFPGRIRTHPSAVARISRERQLSESSEHLRGQLGTDPLFRLVTLPQKCGT